MQPPKLEIVFLLHSLQLTFRLVVTELTLICTLLLCVIETSLIMVNVYRFLKTGLKVLLQSSPLEIHISIYFIGQICEVKEVEPPSGRNQNR